MNIDHVERLSLPRGGHRTLDYQGWKGKPPGGAAESRRQVLAAQIIHGVAGLDNLIVRESHQPAHAAGSLATDVMRNQDS